MDVQARKALADSLGGREVRRIPAATLEVRESGDTLTMTGWASVTERAYDMGYYQETIKRGAFAKTLREQPDVQLLLNHEGLPLARTLSGTLRLTEDERGLAVEADLNPADPDVQRLMPKVQRGDIDQMSFAFRVTRQTWDDDYENREISEVSLHRGDVSIVNQGANPATSFSMRSVQDWLAGQSKDEVIALLRAMTPEEPEEAEQSERMPLGLYVARARALALNAA